jgi:hypothetical protein
MTRPTTPRLALIALALAALVAACGGPAVGATPSSPAPAQPTSGVAATPTPPPVGPTDSPTTTATPTPAPTLPHVPPLQPPPHASRIVISDLRIDLPVVSGDLQPPPSYPLCDVAAYVTLFEQPYELGITYISAHAQKGMFLPLLNASKVNDGQRLLGMTVSVYIDDGRRFDYEISQVLRHRTDYSLVDTIPLDEQTLIMQTSEGVYGTKPKLQVVAKFVRETNVVLSEARPEPQPRDCNPGD